MNVKLLSIAVAGAILMSGCGPKYYTTNVVVDPTKNSASITAAGEGKEFGFINHASLLNNAITYPLQLAAEKTIEVDKKYFSITDPMEISNLAGIKVNTAKEYLEKCANNTFAQSLLYLTNPCKVAGGNLNFPAGGKLNIKMYDDKDRPSDIASYDAKVILAYLKEQELLAQAH
ncbi:MAG: hypothetical protein WCW84_08095 [Sulfurimonas sp.]|jgi:hypothetical protein